MKPVVVIIGAGPAGLTAALELVRDGRAHPVILEGSNAVGGISRTIEYKGNRMDIGGHRFFSKSDWVMNWWREILPIHSSQPEARISYHGSQRDVGIKQVSVKDPKKVMLVRDRLSRIYFLRKYFDYPIKLNAATLTNLGPLRLLRIGVSYVWSSIFPRIPMRSLEDFLVNRFGKELYRTFFKDYTEKVWGVSCTKISAEWGAQRIKGLSIIEALRHAIRKRFSGIKVSDVPKTSLIEHFLYPCLGPGQLWQEVARKIQEAGGEIRLGHTAKSIHHVNGRVLSVGALDTSGQLLEFQGDYFISTMPIKDLVSGMQPPAPSEINAVATALPYRDFITVGLLVSGMKDNSQARSIRSNNMPPDNWIYIQERDVRIGRLQIFNNWSPDLVADPTKVWLGLEYFCQEGDELWQMSDHDMINFAAMELQQIGMIDCADVLDGTVVKVPKTYPAYFGAYNDFPLVRTWLDEIDNLFLVGRNGMHRYNNQDHSMLTAKLAVEAILDRRVSKAEIWAVNIDDDYHEETTRDA